MARLVPARPIFTTDAEKTALLALEQVLDDSHVVFQQRPSEGYLVAHPDKGLCVLIVREGARAHDPDTESFDGVDLTTAARAVQDAIALPTGAAAWLPDTERPLVVADARIAFAEAAALVPAVAAAMTGSRPLDDDGMERLLQSLSPGATPYRRDEVTEAQKRWREAGRGEADSAVGRGVAETDAMPVATIVAEPQAGAPAESAPAESATVEPAPPYPAPAEPAPEKPKPGQPDISDDHPLVRLLRQSVETVTDGKPIFVAGVQVSPTDATSIDFLLPALLIAAAEDWAPVVASREGKGGFHIRLRTDNDALLGYKVVGLDPATPFLLMLPVVDKVRRSLAKDEYSLDPMVLQFMRWLSSNRFDTGAVADIDVRVALSI